MLEYILYSLVIIYYGGFCCAVAYVSYKEYKKEQEQRIKEYDQIPTENPGIEMLTETEFDNRLNK